MGVCNIKKMENVEMTLKIIPDEDNAHIGFHFAWCHVELDIKMEYSRREAWQLVESHMTKAFFELKCSDTSHSKCIDCIMLQL